MSDIREKIAAGLEQAFASNGFAETGVDALREATQVSLRTLYKYCPSREVMILTALERRHRRYRAFLFTDLPENGREALETMLDRVGAWMQENASHGCLFHAAVAAQPESVALRTMLERHKRESAAGLAAAADLSEHETTLLLIHEGLTQTWPLLGPSAVESAKSLAFRLFDQDAAA